MFLGPGINFLHRAHEVHKRLSNSQSKGKDKADKVRQRDVETAAGPPLSPSADHEEVHLVLDIPESGTPQFAEGGRTQTNLSDRTLRDSEEETSHDSGGGEGSR